VIFVVKKQGVGISTTRHPVRLSCLTSFGLMQICSRQICAGIQLPWMVTSDFANRF